MANSTWTEPSSPATANTPPQYPYNHVVASTESGNLIECDDTPGRERIRIQHGKGYTFIEIHPNGDVVHKIYGIGYEIIANNKNVLISGDVNMTVEGDYNLHVKGDYNLQVDGNSNHMVEGDSYQLINGTPNNTIQGDLNLNTTGSINLNAQGGVFVNSDMTVRGDIGGTQTISSVGNITSQQNIIATLSLRTVGSLLIGPSALLTSIPAQIITMVSSVPMTMTAPEFNLTGPMNVVGSITATDFITNTGVTLNTHVHPGVVTGPSSTGLPVG